MTLAEYEAYPEDARKIEFFDSETGLAWMLRDGPTIPHERPVRMLVALVRQIAMTRGSPIRCIGEASVKLLDSEFGQVRAMHPDEMIYLHPERADPVNPSFVAVGQDTYPDVVLEVDHTSDTRRDKLKLYEEWGFPELWVEVPETYSASRPRGLKPELRIYLLEEDRYVLSEESRAFPGWLAAEIHEGLNEPVTSEATAAVLVRVGRALGAREGTGPEDDPLLGPFGREKHAEGLAEGLAEGRAEGRAGLVRRILERRGIRLSAEFPPPGQRALLADASDEALVTAASTATSEAAFFRRLRR